jgi:hypothetical protein
MTSPQPASLIRLFQRIAPASFFDGLRKRYDLDLRNGIYTMSVVVWLMIFQRLNVKRTLASAVQSLVLHGPTELLSDCKRVQEDKIASGTSGYCQARQRLTKQIAMDVADHVFQQLGSEMREGWSGLQRPIFLIDGSTLRLPHNRELVKAFPPGRNRHGANHWPVLRIVVFHDVYSGLATRPSWGAMYGKGAVSEQALAEEALERLPSDAMVMADCNFGIFAFAYAVQESGRPMILRLTQVRAKKILGQRLLNGVDQEVIWQSSRWDRKAHPSLPPQAEVRGRLMVCENPSRPEELLYFLTNLGQPREEIVAMYKLRWNVETDLRALKQTVGLAELSSQRVEMAEKELLLAVVAYNLVRAVMCLAAKKAGLAPRKLSFSHVQDVVHAALPGLCQATTENEFRQRMDRMLHYAAQCKLPNRSRSRSYPRRVWGRGGSHPSHGSKGRNRTVSK